MEESKEKEIEKRSYNLIHKLALLIEILVSLGVIPVQLMKLIHDNPVFPDGHGGWVYEHYYYNMWDNTETQYMVLLNILFATSIIYNLLCIIFFNKINKKIIIVAHVLFVISIITFIIIFKFASQSRKY